MKGHRMKRSSWLARLAVGTLGACLLLTGCGPTPKPEPTYTIPLPPSSDSATETAPSEPTSEAPSTTAELPSQVETQIPPVAARDEAFQSEQSGGQVDVNNYLVAVIKDADRVWTDYFKKIGGREPQVTYHILGADTARGQEASFTSKCASSFDSAGKPVYTTVDTDYPNAFYCTLDDNGVGGIVLPLNTFARMWSGNVDNRQSKHAGDFAAATLAAHEFGHHVADELKQQFTLPDVKGANKEILADCFSGVWAYTAFYSGYLESGDVEEAIAAVESIGDPKPGGVDPHGSAEQRGTAWKLGYNTGAPAKCITAYWPGVTFK